MVALVRHIVVLCLGPEMPGLGETRFTKKVQGAVNGRQSQMGIFQRQLVVHLLSRDVFLFQEGIEDQFTLASKFQLVFSEVFLEDSHFFDMFGHGDRFNLSVVGIKDETAGPVKSDYTNF